MFMNKISNKSINLLVEQVGVGVKNLTNKKSNMVNNSASLKILSQNLSGDVVELAQKRKTFKDILTKKALKNRLKNNYTFSDIAREFNTSTPVVVNYLQKYGLYKKTREVVHYDVNIEPAQLQKLADEGKTLDEMASELGVSVGIVRSFLKKYSITTELREELRLLRKYFNATDKAEKDAIFSEVDVYLKEIAKGKVKSCPTISYDDCLQDIRYRFLELMEQIPNRKKKTTGVVFREIRENYFQNKKQLKTCSLDEAMNLPADDDVFSVKNFEERDYVDSMIKKSKLPRFQQEILDLYINKDLNTTQIADTLYWMKTFTVRNELNKALRRMTKFIILDR